MPKLTPASVEKHKPGKTRREIPDAASPALYLIIQPSPEPKALPCGSATPMADRSS